MRPYKCFIGNLDGDREGLVWTTSKKEAIRIIGTSMYDFNNYWEECETPTSFTPDCNILYTRPINNKYGLRDNWTEGRCKLEK